MRSKYSTETNETVMKCCFRKPVIFSSNVLVTFHSHVSLGTVAIPYQSHAGLLVQNTGSWETLSSPASRSAEPRRAPPTIAHVSPTRAPARQGRGAPGSERFVATSHPQVRAEVFWGCSLKFLLALVLREGLSSPFSLSFRPLLDRTD